MTNTPAASFFEQLNSINEQLAGAPSGVSVFVFVCIAAFALRWWNLFPDKWVAPSCTLGGMIVFCLLAPYAQEHMRIWLTKNAILGFIISGMASIAILKFGDKLPFVGALLRTEPPTTETKP